MGPQFRFIISIVFVFTYSIGCFGIDELDQKLNQYIQYFKLKPLAQPEGKKAGLYRLGRELFFEEELAGNRNISCATCHHPHNQTVDWLAMSLGEGATGTALDRRQLHARAIRRSTPHLFNLGVTGMNFMFWDARVRFDPYTHRFETPLEIFNGHDPKRKDITEVLSSAHAMQALFPIISPDEMLGLPGSNPLADIEDVEKLLEALENRIFKGKKAYTYRSLMQLAWPRVPEHKWNIGHLLEAIAHFETHAFAVVDTPWDQYLRGDVSALNENQKKGAVLFFEKGRCIHCHSGDALGGTQLHNIAVPKVGMNEPVLDRGLGEVTGFSGHNFVFKVPTLRNVAFTFPYMHNGAYFTLEQVVDHYSDVFASFRNYNVIELLNVMYTKNYVSPIRHFSVEPETDILSNLSFKLVTEPNLFTSEEKEQLVEFMREALSDSEWRPAL